jgi:hypothetical protein
VQLLAATIDRCYRAFVLLGVSGSLRMGELIGLRRSDFDLVASLVWIEGAVFEMARRDHQEAEDRCGCAYGRSAVVARTSASCHFDVYAEPGPEGRTGVRRVQGATPLRTNFTSVWGVLLMVPRWWASTSTIYVIPATTLSCDDGGE